MLCSAKSLLTIARFEPCNLFQSAGSEVARRLRRVWVEMSSSSERTNASRRQISPSAQASPESPSLGSNEEKATQDSAFSAPSPTLSASPPAGYLSIDPNVSSTTLKSHVALRTASKDPSTRGTSLRRSRKLPEATPSATPTAADRAWNVRLPIGKRDSVYRTAARRI
jgi:hypothetical protein